MVISTLRGLLPKEQREIVIPAALMNGDALHVVSPYILPSQEIEFRAGAVQEWLPIVAQDTDQAGRKEIHQYNHRTNRVVKPVRQLPAMRMQR